jgi:hypothetical protein
MRRRGPRFLVLLFTIPLFATVALGHRAFGQAAPQNQTPTVDHDRLDFMGHKIGTKTTQQVTVKNRANAVLKLTARTSKPDYTIDKGCQPVYGAKKSDCVLDINFSPLGPGDRSAELQIEYQIGAGGKGAKPLKVALNGNGLIREVLGRRLATALTLCILYWLAMVVIRWNRVAMPTRELLRTQILSLQTELGEKPANLQGLLQEAKDLTNEATRRWDQRLADFLFWSRGQELSGWGLVHQVEVQMIPFVPDPKVRTWLETSEQRLRTINDSVSVALANAIHQELASASPDADRRRALLSEALATIYDSKDTSYASLVSWQNKTSWLVGCGLVLIVVLTGAFPAQSVLFLVGGAGGLISRMSRSLDRKDVPTDYGASWSYLFLSPIAGALGAWAGILLSDILQQAKVLGPTFNATWDHPMASTTLAIALVFGFSERLLDGVLDKLVATVGIDKTTTATASQPSPTQPASAVPPGGGPTITSAKLDDATGGKPYTAKLAATGGTGKLTWSLAPGSALPAGLQLAADGTISGTPTAQGTFTFKVTVTDESSKTDSKELTLKVN